MNCEQAKRMISETPEAAGAALKGHLASCAACARALAFSRSLNAALVSLPQPRPSAAFSGAVLAAWGRRPAAAPVWPLAAALSLSSAGLAAGALNLSLSIPRVASAAAHVVALLQVAEKLAIRALPSPRGGVELSAAAVMAVALFLTLSMPAAPKTRLTGAKS